MLYVNQNLVTAYPTDLCIPADTMRPETWGKTSAATEVPDPAALIKQHCGYPLRIYAQVRSLRGGGGYSTPMPSVAGPNGKLYGKAIANFAVKQHGIICTGWLTLAQDDFTGAGWEALVYESRADGSR